MYKINIKENLSFVYDFNYLMVLVGIVDDY